MVKPKIGKAHWTSILMALGIIGIFSMLLFVLMTGGLGSLTAAPGSEAAAEVAKATVAATGGLCYDTDTKTSDVNVKVVQSIADSTGAKTAASQDVFLYMKGEVNEAETLKAIGTGVYNSTSSDLTCGQEFFLIFENTSYYHAKTDVIKAENVRQYVQMEADLIATITVTGTNSSSGSKQATSMAELMTTSETATGDYLNIKANTAKGVLRNIAVCFDYNTSNFTSVEVVGATEMNVPSGVASGYEECWKTTLGTKGADGIYRLQDYAEQKVQLKIVAASGVNPQVNTTSPTSITALVLDEGTYRKAADGVLFSGYQNADTLASVGATDVSFLILVY